MLGSPPFVKNVGKSKVSVGGSGGRQTLPGFQLVAGSRKRDHPGDLLMLGKTGGGGRSVRTAREYYFIPKQVRLLWIEKPFPFSLRVFLGQSFDEGQRTGNQTVSLGNVYQCTMVLPGGGLQADVAQALSGIVRFLGHGGKPTVGIVGLN